LKHLIAGFAILTVGNAPSLDVLGCLLAKASWSCLVYFHRN